jgi:hypothetical protein
VIAGFYRGVNVFALLGCYAAFVVDITDVSGQHIGSNFIGQAVLTVEDGTDGLPRKVGNYKYTYVTSEKNEYLIEQNF